MANPNPSQTLDTRLAHLKSIILHHNDKDDDTLSRQALSYLERVMQPLGTEMETQVPQSSLPEPIHFTAVGMRYRGDHRFTDTDTLTFDPEPTNRYDPHAIRIVVGGNHVAYVSREDCATVLAFVKAAPAYTTHLVKHFAQSAVFACSACKKE